MIKENIIINKFICNWYDNGFENFNLEEFLLKENIDRNKFQEYYIDQNDVLFTIHINIFNMILSILDSIILQGEKSTLKLNKYLNGLKLLSQSHNKEIHIISETTPIIFKVLSDSQKEQSLSLNSEIAKKQLIIINELRNDGYIKALDPGITSKLFRAVLVSSTGYSLDGFRDNFTFDNLEEFILSI